MIRKIVEEIQEQSKCGKLVKTIKEDEQKMATYQVRYIY